MDQSFPDHFKKIRSFVLRTTRITEAQKKAMEELYPVYGVNFQTDSLACRDLFPGFSKYVLEIGFGMGDATLELAQNHPDTAFLGVEVHTPGVGRVLLEIQRRGLKNLKVLCHDATEVLPRLEKETWDGIHIFFPDPWPKKKHNKRRLIQHPFVQTLLPPLKTGGYIYAATDWEEYAEQILQVFDTTPGLKNPYQPWAQVSWRPKTKFERKGLEAQRVIREIFFQKS